MGSFKHSCAFDPLDLEIIDRVYEAAWAKLELASRSVTGSVILSGKRRYASRSWLALQDT